MALAVGLSVVWVQRTRALMHARQLANAESAAVLLHAYQTEPAIRLVEGTTLGRVYFPAGSTAQGGHGQTVAGVQADAGMVVKYHIHVHLSLYVNGAQIAIPPGIGIVKPWQVIGQYVQDGRLVYWLHTHDATGIIHVESPSQQEFTLGQFFQVWGQPLSTMEVAGFKGPVQVFVDGKRFTGDPNAIPLTGHKQITFELGNPLVLPARYNFPPGL